MSKRADKYQYLRNKAGIYFLYMYDRLLYVGCSSNIYVRFLEHSFNGMFFRDIQFKEMTGYNKKEYMLVEAIIIKTLKPAKNKMIIDNTEGFYIKYVDLMEYEYDFYEEVAEELIEEFANQ